MKVSVLTSALPQRDEMLAEAKASVLAQECPGVEVEHLVTVDWDGEGAGPILNRLLAMAEGDWVMVLDDDDLLKPNHLATVTDVDLDAYDVIYSLPEVRGGTFSQYHAPWDPTRLAFRNIVSHNALMRTSLVRSIGGWSAIRQFDWDLFRRLEAAGADFCQLRSVTWIYRLHGSNWSQGTLEGAPS